MKQGKAVYTPTSPSLIDKMVTWAETRNRKHSKELFKLMRESYGEVEIIGYYDSPEDYVAGNLQNDKFAHVEEEAPFEGNMNIQYNVDRRPTLNVEDMDEQETKMSQMKLGNRTARAATRVS